MIVAQPDVIGYSAWRVKCSVGSAILKGRLVASIIQCVIGVRQPELTSKQHIKEANSFVSIYSRGMASHVGFKGFVGENCVLVYKVSDQCHLII